jgi:PAS domain S-box-containing protein
VKTVRDTGELLRDRAEELLRRSRSEPPSVPAELDALVHELQVHQMELQMQNEALRDAQHEIEVSRERYRELYDLAPVAYFSLDVDGRITDANQAAGALLGVGAAALMHERLSRFVTPEHATVFEHHRREVMASADRCTCALELICADGQQREVRVESLRSRRVGTGWRCMMVDVTDVHRLQRRLQQTQKLEAISALASGVAHEFNNILMGVLGCAEVGLGKLDTDSAARAPVEQIKQVALRGRTVVAQLLGFGRRQSVQQGVVDLHGAVTTSQGLLRQRLGDGVKLELQLEATAAFVPGDAAQIEQILLNLAGNARDAMPRGGSLRIRTRNFAPDELPAEVRSLLGQRPCVSLMVIDTGTGMDRETRARALEPFFTTKPAGVGTGLGLAMVHAAARQAGGHVEIRSGAGVGTAVHVYWPQVMTGVPEPRVKSESLLRCAGATRVAVVDDDELVRMGVRHYLQRAGFEVLEAAGGEEALALLRAQSGGAVHLLVTDVLLPGMQGLDLAAAARALQPRLHVLFMSAHAREVLVERGWLERDMPVLQKPFTADELEQAIADTLGELADAHPR